LQALSHSNHRLLKDVSDFVKKEQKKTLVLVLFTKDIRITRIESYQTRIKALARAFMVSAGSR
jgi:hypothetical protein